MSDLKSEAGAAPLVKNEVTKVEATSSTSLEQAEDVKVESKDGAIADIKEEDVKAEVEDNATPSVKNEDVKVDLKDNDANDTSNTKEEDVKADSKDNATLNGNKSDIKHGQKGTNGILKTSRQIDHTNFNNNSKYDPSVLPQTDDAQAIRNQVEFYFSDSNLPTDKHMWEMTDGTTNLPISIENICKFGRMKRFQPISAVVAALKESSFLEVTGAEGQEQVKRKTPYDPSFPKVKSESRSVYVKGFGDEERSSQFDIEAFFAQFGPTKAVRLRRTEEKLFKGSVFVEFDSDEIAEKFLALDPKPLWKGKHELLITSKTAYKERKLEEIRDGTTQPKKSWSTGKRGGFRGRGRGFQGGNRENRGDRDGDNDRKSRGNGYRGDRDPDDWKKRREDDRANGFKDHRGGRGSKSRGRGNHDNKGPRNNDRNRDRDEKKSDKVEADMKAEKPTPEKNDKKRVREEDHAESEPATKKVDSKPEVATEAAS